MKKIFIYYSLSGNGDIVAEYLGNRNLDIRKVVPQKQLSNNMLFRILKGGFLAGINYKDKLVDFDSNISLYDEVIIGSPVWNARLSTPINAILNRIDVTGKKVKFILYSGSGEGKNAIKTINEKYPDAKTIILKEPLKNKSEITRLNEFIQRQAMLVSYFVKYMYSVANATIKDLRFAV